MIYGPEGEQLQPHREERPESVNSLMKRLALVMGATDLVLLAQTRDGDGVRLVCSAQGMPAAMLGLAHEAPMLVRANLQRVEPNEQEGG